MSLLNNNHKETEHPIIEIIDIPAGLRTIDVAQKLVSVSMDKEVIARCNYEGIELERHPNSGVTTEDIVGYINYMKALNKRKKSDAEKAIANNDELKVKSEQNDKAAIDKIHEDLKIYDVCNLLEETGKKDLLHFVGLIKEQGTINAIDSEGNNVLMYAISKDMITLSSKLVLFGFKLDQQNNRKESALIMASLYGDDWLAVKLLDFGTDYTLTDNKGNNAIHYAREFGRLRIIESIVSMEQNDNRKTPEIQKTHPNLEDICKQLKNTGNKDLLNCAELIKREGATNEITPVWISALLECIKKGEDNIALAIIDAGVNIYVKLENDKSMLELATMYSNVQVVKKILEMMKADGTLKENRQQIMDAESWSITISNHRLTGLFEEYLKLLSEEDQ